MTQGIRHMNPFRETVKLYRKAGWFGTLPLPYKEKHPPPTGMIGKRAKHPEPHHIQEWLSDGKRHNICIRLAGVDEEHELLGIDVDHYESGGKQKKGGDELKELEAKLGSLPDTWTATSRIDGISGIRFYRVPRGLAFRGKANGQNSDIDIICKGNRFAVVWPSIHPSGETYWFFPPGVVPLKQNRKLWDGVIPEAKTMPVLQDTWIDFLSQNRMRAPDDEAIDMESNPTEINQWADDTFHGDDDTPMCAAYAAKVQKQKDDIANEATSHDKIVKAHWNLIKLAEEGHVGLSMALNEIEGFWAEDVMRRQKRDPEEVRMEVWRSRTNALRKIKAQIDEKVQKGAAGVQLRCDGVGGLCNTTIPASSDPDDPLADVPRGVIKAFGEYKPHDDDNARHFVDMYSSVGTGLGPSVRYAEGYGWLIWHNGANGGQPHWERDERGDQTIRRMWWRIRDVQQDNVENALYVDMQNKINDYSRQVPGVSKADVDLAKARYAEWKKWAIRSGLNLGAENAIRAMKSVPGVNMNVNELDQNPLLIGVANGVLELNGEDVELKPARATDYITLNTGVPYEEPSARAVAIWNDYLETFLPDPELRRCVQIVLGHCIVGGNDEKVFVALKGDPNTGKSTMINAIEASMGDYASTVDQSMLKPNGHFNESLAAALNNRFVICSEFESKDELSASLMKRITGGTDKVSIPIKHSMAMKEGVPQFVLVLATNGVPKISGSDKALKNRLKTIPFTVVPGEIDKKLANIVKNTCRVAVLNWLVDGYKEYKRIGYLPTHQLIEEATNQFFAELDDETHFYHEWLETTNSAHDMYEPEWCVTRGEMTEHFRAFWLKSGLPESRRPSPHALTARLRELGLKGTEGLKTRRIGTRTTRWWFGVKLVTPKESAKVFQMGPMKVEK